jgi:hypothetical protein
MLPGPPWAVWARARARATRTRAGARAGAKWPESTTDMRPRVAWRQEERLTWWHGRGERGLAHCLIFSFYHFQKLLLGPLLGGRLSGDWRAGWHWLRAGACARQPVMQSPRRRLRRRALHPSPLQRPKKKKMPCAGLPVPYHALSTECRPLLVAHCPEQPAVALL